MYCCYTKAVNAKFLYLLAYSPDSNPMEGVFGGLKERRERLSLKASVKKIVLSYF